MKINKSKQELARIISENGGWRSGEFAAQDGDGTGSIDFFKSKPQYYPSGKFWHGDYNSFERISRTDVTIKNYHQTILSREEYFNLYPSPDADGWIEWKGGECPVDADSLIDLRFTDGSEHFNTDADWDWSNASEMPISHYRPSKKEDKPELCESVMRSIPEPESIDGLCAKVTEENKHQHIDAKPTIEQLAADYRNAKDYAERKQQEADTAKVNAEAKLTKLVTAGKVLGLVIDVRH